MWHRLRVQCCFHKSLELAEQPFGFPRHMSHLRCYTCVVLHVTAGGSSHKLRLRYKTEVVTMNTRHSLNLKVTIKKTKKPKQTTKTKKKHKTTKKNQHTKSKPMN